MSSDKDKYAGPGPGEWKELNPTPEELFNINNE